MTTFSDKANFSLKQMIAAVIIAAGVGGGISRFEFKMDNIETKLDTMIALIDTTKKHNNVRFAIIEKDLLVAKEDIKAITTSLTAMLKPEEIEIKKQR